MTVTDGTIRQDRTIDQIVALHKLPFLDRSDGPRRVHRLYHDPNKVQKSSLLSIKTVVAQRIRELRLLPHNRRITREVNLMNPGESDRHGGETAKAAGAKRFWMGAAWRQAHDGKESMP